MLPDPAPTAHVAYLRTLGSPVLLSPEREMMPVQRTKDMALLVYLCVEAKPTYSRRLLANLLWGDRPVQYGRHSLTQAVRRIANLLGRGVLAARRDAIDWFGGIRCDALDIETAYATGRVPGTPVDAAPFLGDFDPGDGADEFRFWSDERRAHYRLLAVRLLDTMAAQAVARRDWESTLELAFRLVEIEPIYEEGHRRIMHAWSELGERALALQHYRRFADWLRQEVDADPDPRTQNLARDLQGSRPDVRRADSGNVDSTLVRRSIWR